MTHAVLERGMELVIQRKNAQIREVQMMEAVQVVMEYVAHLP